MKRHGFSLIELLVVIGVVAILAAITFPVAAGVRRNALWNSDLSRMSSLRTALQLYDADQGGYPPALFGYVTLYGATTSGYVLTNDGAAPAVDLSNVVPPSAVKGYLYPKRIDSYEGFQPAQVKVEDAREFFGGNGASPENRVVWPAQAETGFSISGPTDPNCAKQAYGPTTIVKFPGSTDDATYYKVSGFDVQQVRSITGPRNELHYALFWTGWGLAAGGCALGNGSDDPRQLGYANPPETTIVTWSSTFRAYEAGVPTRRANDIVLFLGGSARQYDSRDMSERSWKAEP